MLKRADKETQAYLKERKQEFDWLKTILQRGYDLRVAQIIVSHQQAFFTNKERPIKPLTLKEVAKELKYMNPLSAVPSMENTWKLNLGFSSLRNSLQLDYSKVGQILRLISQLILHKRKSKNL